MRNFILCLRFVAVSAVFLALVASAETARAQVATGTVSNGAASTALLQLFDASDQTFSTLLGRLSQNLNVAFIAEGAPLKAGFSPDNVDALKKFMSSADAQPKEVVEKVAACFDYDATYSNPHLVLLHKRYSDTDDIPFVTYEEGLRDLRHLSTALGTFLSGSGKDSNRTFDDLVLSLSEDQLQALGSGIPISQLSKEQQNLAWRWTVLRYLRDVPSTVDGLVYHLNAVSSERSAFRWFPLMDTDIQVFGYEGPFSSVGMTNWAEIPLSHHLSIELPNTVSAAILPKKSSNSHETFVVILGFLTPSFLPPTIVKHLQSELEEMKVDGKAPDLDAPVPEDYAKLTAPLPPCTKTLQEAVAQITHDFPTVQASVDDALATKPVSIVGAQNAVTARERMQALCDVYGLTMLHPKENTFAIGLPTYNSDTKLSDISAVVRCYIPLPWQKALVGLLPKAGDLLITNEQKARKDRGGSPLPARSATLLREGFQVPQTAQALWFTSARHKLRVAVQPLVEAAPDKRLPMRSLHPETRQLLMFMVIADSLSSFYDVQQNATVPDYLANFDQCFLLGHASRAQNQLYFSLCTTGSDGKPKVHVSGGGGNFPQPSQTSPSR